MRKLARCSSPLQEYDFIVVHRTGTANVNVDCLSRYPRPSTDEAPFLYLTKGEIMALATYVAMMARGANPLHTIKEGKKMWDDVEVLRLLRTHKYSNGLSAKTRDRIFRRARGYLG